jgi:hypothetical protein
MMATDCALHDAGQAHPPSPATFHRWMREMAEATKLREIIKGVYLNRLGRHDASPAAAAQYVRARAIPSRAWVLEQSGATNNFGDTITCVIPTHPTWSTPQIVDRRTAAGTFRFFAMPARLILYGEVSDCAEDILDARFDYPRATPEKALLDWIYLGASPRSRLTRPPLDLDLAGLNRRRLLRLAKNMGLTQALDDWMAQWRAYQEDEEVRDNASHRFSF